LEVITMTRARKIVSLLGLSMALGAGLLLGASANRISLTANEDVAVATHPGETPGPGEPTLAEVRSATERFRDVNVALAEGFIRDPGNMCETAEMMGKPASLGAMGVHYFRPDLLGITAPPSPRVNGNGTHTDFRKPSILIYEPQADGSLELVAVENLVFADAWRASGRSTPPTFHGVPYDTMRDDPTTATDEAHMFEPHFDRHVWLYRENPNGIFAPLNPAVTCAHHRTSQAHSTSH
jgi:hypothetical protein